jgi:hypothetical protein
MKRLKYSDLSKHQRIFVNENMANGCGAKGSFFNPPDYCFGRSACAEHDFDFWVGGNKRDFKSANKKFYRNMIQNCKDARSDGEINYFTYLWVKGAAWRYYKAVSIFGKDSFNFTETPNGKNELYFLMLHKVKTRKFKLKPGEVKQGIRG